MPCPKGIQINQCARMSLMLRRAPAASWLNDHWQAEMKKIEKCSLLILDDLFLIGLDAKERSILMEIIEDRHGLKSIIITSQLPVESWYDAIGDPTVADAIQDRIVHSAHKIELTGDSVRKINAKKK